MMNTKFLTALAGFLLITSATPASAVPISDDYIGSDDHGYGDVIGSLSDFQIFSADVSLTGTILTVDIITTFAGKGDDGLFSSYTVGGTGIGYGDLFLSSSWDPFGAAPYYGDDASTGTTWSYGFSLDDRFMSETDAGAGTLYSLDSGDNTDILISDGFITGATFRNGQEVAVDLAGSVTAVSAGTWGIDTGTDTVSFEIDLAGTDLLLGDEIAFHWGFTCANDVIEGSVSAVPVPAAAWLFGTGLLAIVGIARRRKV